MTATREIQNTTPDLHRTATAPVSPDRDRAAFHQHAREMGAQLLRMRAEWDGSYTRDLITSEIVQLANEVKNHTVADANVAQLLMYVHKITTVIRQMQDEIVRRVYA